MQLTLEEKQNCTVVRLEEKVLGATNYNEFKAEITQLANDGKKRLILDFCNVDMVDSSGLGALISTVKTMGKEGKVVLCGVNGTVENVFRMTRLQKLFPTYRSLDEAEEAITA